MDDASDGGRIRAGAGEPRDLGRAHATGHRSVEYTPVMLCGIVGLAVLVGFGVAACASNVAGPNQAAALPGPEASNAPPSLAHGPCEPAAAVDARGFVRCKDGRVHRPAAVQCPSQIAVDEVAGPRRGGDECARNADCTAKPNGYCAAEGQLPTRACHYGCTQDADCGDDALCMCDAPVGRCLPATCRADGDCGGGLLCSKVQPLRDLDYGAFACDTARDQCNTDQGCLTATAGRMPTCDYVDGARTCVAGDRAVY